MPSLTINIPDDFYQELNNIATQLNETPEQCMLLALNHLIQTETIENAIEGIHRINEGETLVDFPEIKEALGLEIKFHPAAMEELSSLDEEDQVEVLGQLIERMSADEEELAGTLDLVLKDEPNNQVILSGFGFGDIVYQVGDIIAVHHIALIDDEEDMDGEEYDETIDEEMMEENA